MTTPGSSGPSPLSRRLAQQIAATGPITVAQFMTACLHDPSHGYYATRPALGAEGDFITAPLVSQMFGELIGLWAVETWRSFGCPARFRLVELGPGDATLASDVVRAARLDPAFIAAADLWLVETSAPLAKAQRARLADSALTARWTTALDAVPGDAPMILIANELLDCLPARQFVRTATGWAERVIGLDATGALTFGLTASPPAQTPAGDPPLDHDDFGLNQSKVIKRDRFYTFRAGFMRKTAHTFSHPALGAVVEICASQAALGAEIGARLAQDGGAALLIDYGRDGFETGDTLQALIRHQRVDPLTSAGLADLTVHADFPAVLAAARAQGCDGGLLAQGEFLRGLGIEARAQALAHARPDRAAMIARQLARLTGDDQMGRLFKALCLHPMDAAPPPGF